MSVNLIIPIMVIGSILVMAVAIPATIEFAYEYVGKDKVVSDLTCSRGCIARLASHGLTYGGLTAIGETVCVYKNRITGEVKYKSCIQ